MVFDAINLTVGVLADESQTTVNLAGDDKPTIKSIYAKGLPAGLNIVKLENESGFKITGMANTTVESTKVTVVVRDSTGVEYTGTLTVTVSAAPSLDYTATLSGTDVVGEDDVYYIYNGSAENVTLTIVGTDQAFTGSVFIYKQGSDNFVREVQEADEGTPGITLTTTYTIPVNGVGSYIIEILNGDGIVDTIALNIIPVSTGSVGLIVVGN